MATINPKIVYKGANPMLTKTGKERLGPLNITQLAELRAKTTKKKVIAKINREILRRIAA